MKESNASHNPTNAAATPPPTMARKKPTPGAPGTSPANGNELTGAGPEGTYARVAVSNSAGTGGVRNWANGTLHLPATGTAYEATVLLLCSAATGATVVDWEYLDDPIPVGPQGGVGTLSGVSYTQS